MHLPLQTPARGVWACVPPAADRSFPSAREQVNDAGAQRTDLVIMDAQQISAGPVATVHLKCAPPRTPPDRLARSPPEGRRPGGWRPPCYAHTRASCGPAGCVGVPAFSSLCVSPPPHTHAQVQDPLGLPRDVDRRAAGPAERALRRRGSGRGRARDDDGGSRPDEGSGARCLRAEQARAHEMAKNAGGSEGGGLLPACC